MQTPLMLDFGSYPLAVEVLAITIFLSLLLAVFFVVLFLGSQRRTRHSMEQDALLPLNEGRPRIKPTQSGPVDR